MNERVKTERLSAYSKGDASDIGTLMAMLSKRFSGEPIAKELLKTIIESPHHDQLVARLNARIVGVATMSVVMGAGMNKLGYLEDFVVDEEVRGQGVATALWNEIIRWCEEKGVDLEFTSGASKEAAHVFYAKHGAEVRDTTVFHVSIDSSEL